MGIRSEETFPKSNTDVRECLGEIHRGGQHDGEKWHSQAGYSTYRGYFYIIIALHIFSISTTTNKCI
jgi:hypothetical protein